MTDLNNIDPILENLIYVLGNMNLDYPIIDTAMTSPTNETPVYLVYSTDRFRINRISNRETRNTTVKLELTFHPLEDSSYVNKNPTERAKIKSAYYRHYSNELLKIVKGLCANDNPFAEAYTGLDDKGTAFRFSERLDWLGVNLINQFGSDENQNWAVRLQFELIGKEKAFCCGC